MSKIYLYPLWLRLWHWLNALIFIVLIFTGISLHYSDVDSLWIPFNISIILHNSAGILITAMYVFYLIFNIVSGNIKHYIPKLKGFTKRMLMQVQYYLLGIFNKDPHPFHSSEKSKFNPMQQVAYLSIMFLLMPLICISGILLMFPEVAPTEFMGMGGVWPMAFAHIIVGFFLSVFMFVHIYLATTGHTSGELFKSMITGYHHHDAEEVAMAEAKYASPIRLLDPKKKIFPIIFYNPVTISGTLIAGLSFIFIAFLAVVEFFEENTNPYIGIITFVILPTIMIVGILAMAFGVFKENRRALFDNGKAKTLPVIDLNNTKHQLAVIFAIVGSVLLLGFSVFGSFKAYEYTETDEFCGTVCHEVMEPEYTAYKDSPHSRVGCVKCHIGSGTDWYVKSKFSGAYQLYSVAFNKFSRPIPTPVTSLRPAQGTCEQCHWPKHFNGQKNFNFDFYLSDEQNTKTALTLSINTGGGSQEYGNNDGIHWHMNIANEITYLHTDTKREDIPWVKVKNRATGVETVYAEHGAVITDEMLRSDKIRKMDCIDCHNRPSHVYKVPNRTINSLLTAKKIDETLPYIKRLSVQALEYYVTSRPTSFDDIKNYINGYYKENYPDLLTTKQVEIDQAINQINTVYRRNYFPGMGVNWKNFPNNIGHLYSKGCFRCHDGKHESPDGKIISKDCNVCHKITFQKAPGQEAEFGKVGEFIQFAHPGGLDKFVKDKDCSRCHGAKKQGVTSNE
jgi:thiosulfate reductase cytochrome b subunit